jgi:hypothetical protein
MASTRAKARCLRDLTNIGMTALEELGDITEVINGEDESRAAQIRKDNVRKFVGKQTKVAQENNAGTVNSEAGKTAPELGNQTEMKSQELPPATAGNTETSSESKSVKTRQTAKSGNGNGNGKSKSDKIPLMSEAQKNAIFNLSRRRNISVEELENLATKTFNMTLENLSSADASMFIRTLQQAS